MGLRLLSLLLAILCWLFVNAGEQQARTTVQVPVVYAGLHRGLVIINNRPRYVEVEVSGPRTLLSILDPERMRPRLQLGDLMPGQTSLRLSPDMFNVPRHTLVTRVIPSEITLDVDRVEKRDLKVSPSLTGAPASGYHIASVTVTPKFVTVRGPSRFVAPLGKVTTAPVVVQGMTSDVSEVVALAKPAPRVHLGEKKAQVAVKIVQVVAEREFHNLPIAVRDANHRFRLEPQRVSVTVRGPELKLARLDLSQAAFVDATSAKPGSQAVPVHVKLPEGIELVRQSPDKVKLFVYRAPLPRHS